jgi:hypothetical protein
MQNTYMSASFHKVGGIGVHKTLLAPEFLLRCQYKTWKDLDGWFMVFNAIFNNISVISWRSVLLVEETGVPGENHRFVASH